MKLKPLHDRLIVERNEETEQVKGGILILDAAREKPPLRNVIAAGSGKRLENGTVVALDVKTGDHINCEALSDETAILSGIHGYHDIRIDRSEMEGVRVWSARTRYGDLGSVRAESRCGALRKYLLCSIGNTDEATRIYGDAAAAIQRCFPEERLERPSPR